MHSPNTVQEGVGKIKFIDDKKLCIHMCLSIASRLPEYVNNEGQQFQPLTRLYINAL